MYDWRTRRRQDAAREMNRLMRKYYLRVWRHPAFEIVSRYVQAPHPRLIAGTLRNAALLARAHDSLGVPA
jgi:hypothetical protein